MVRPHSNSSRRQKGFTYLAVMLLVAIMGAGLGAIGQVWSTVQQRERERQLLFIGDQYREAIGRYVEHGPGGIRQFPRSLEDLILDKRYPTIQRYLRRIYLDPMTNSPEWGLVRTPDGGISGVFSRSEAKPLKVAGFAAREARQENAAHYNEWIFTYEGRPRPSTLPRGTPPPAGGEPQTMFPQE